MSEVLRLREIERFWSHVNERSPEECWLWDGGLLGGGYGEFWTKSRKERYAHRVSWTIAYGTIPDGLFVCHKCDVKACVNPAHLFVGTHVENMADMTAKGRRRGSGHPGSQHSQAKLTEEDIPTIRELYAAGVMQKHIAARFRVSPGTIGFITRGETWKHVP